MPRPKRDPSVAKQVLLNPYTLKWVLSYLKMTNLLRLRLVNKLWSDHILKIHKLIDNYNYIMMTYHKNSTLMYSLNNRIKRLDNIRITRQLEKNDVKPEKELIKLIRKKD